jgi:hypothetical protein
VKIQPSWVSFQSPGTDFVTPSWRASGRLNTLIAYACPMQRCVARAHGGISQRLNPGGAVIRSLLSSEAMVSAFLALPPSVLCVLGLVGR